MESEEKTALCVLCVVKEFPGETTKCRRNKELVWVEQAMVNACEKSGQPQSALVFISKSFGRVARSKDAYGPCLETGSFQ